MIEVPLTWQLAKLGLSISMVLGLGAIAVRASPRLAGLLAGYPLGTALALFFIGLEISPAFATQSAVHTLAGFTASRTFSLPALAVRAALATVIIFTITSLAHWLPPAWAGTLAAFPVTMLPFLLILHLNHGAAPVATVIKHYPMGLGSLLSYTLCVSYTYSTLGLLWGTLAGFAVATLWLLGWMQLTACYQRRTA